MKQKLTDLWKFVKSKKKIFIVISLLLVLCLILIVCFKFYNPKVKDEVISSNKEIYLKESYEYEIGSIPKIEDFTNEKNARIEIYYEDSKIDGKLNKTGEYKVVVYIDEEKYETKIEVKDSLDNEVEELPENDDLPEEENEQDNSSEKLPNEDKSDSSNDNQDIDNNKEKDNIDKEELNNNKEETKPVVKPQPEQKPEPEPAPEPEPEPEPVVTVVSEEKKSDVTEITKYGTKFKQTEKYTLVTYSNGITEKKNVVVSLEVLDYSTFVTSSSSMLDEATKLSKDNTTKRQEAVMYINGYRSEVGAADLVLDEELSIAATIRALELAYSNHIAHTRPNGTSYKTAIDDIYTKPYYYWGENLNGGTYYSTAKYSVESFRESSGHYANMINTRYKKVGIGYVYVPFGTYHHFWVHLYVE